jgi:hypothetical protein
VSVAPVVDALLFQHAGANVEVHPMTEKAPLQIVKPAAGFMEKFRSTRPPTIGGVETVLNPLPILRLGDVRDLFRLHWDEENYWSPELCFVSVPIKGVKKDVLHLIDEEIAVEYLPSGQILRRRLVLASKPHDVFFFCIVPTQNLDNSWNATALEACELAKTWWVKVSSRRTEGVEEYKIDPARDADAFPPTQWPKRTFDELLEVTFRNANIDTDKHPGLLRLIGAKPDLT